MKRRFAIGGNEVALPSAIDRAISDVEFSNRQLGIEPTRFRLEEADRCARRLRDAIIAAIATQDSKADRGATR